MKYTSEVGYVLYTAACFIFALQHCSSESCSNRGDIRLQNGINKFEGRVEVCGSGSDSDRTLIWKSVCNAGWDVNEAMVVCRQLGFSGNLNPIPVLDGTFSDPSSQTIHINYIIKRNFTCQGDERNLLFNCTHNNRSSNYCNDTDSRMKPAGVYCFGQTNGNRCDNNEIRLSNGTNESGRVEVCLGGLWGTVCDRGWSKNDANTVCRQLGYNHAGVICIDRFMTSTSAKQLPTITFHATTLTDISPITYGAISGVLVIIGIIVAALATVVTVVVIKRKRVGQTENSDKKSSMDNPTHDKSISVITTTTRIVSNEEDETLFQNPLYSDVGHRSSNHPYEDTPNGRDESCYSALDHSTEYSTLEPHIPKSYQEQLQPSKDDYSQLHHK